MNEKETAAALRKIKAFTPFNLAGAVIVETRVLAADLARWVEVDGEVVFWVTVLDEALKPHLLLCHKLIDTGATINIAGIHGGLPFAAEMDYSRRVAGATLFNARTLLREMRGVAAAERIVGPAVSDTLEAQPAGATESGDVYL